MKDVDTLKAAFHADDGRPRLLLLLSRPLESGSPVVEFMATLESALGP